jgi:mono/diheme cytochrome c family protein
LKPTASIVLALILCLLSAVTGCGKDDAEKTDAELGLNEQQAHGRRVFKIYCANCHRAYSTQDLKGPGLKGVFKKQYLPSGLLANDNFAENAILRGRNMMPPMGSSLSRSEIENVIAYLHTL